MFSFLVGKKHYKLNSALFKMRDISTYLLYIFHVQNNLSDMLKYHSYLPSSNHGNDTHHVHMTHDLDNQVTGTKAHEHREWWRHFACS